MSEALLTADISFGEFMNGYCNSLKGTLIDAESFDAIQKHASRFPLHLSKFWCLEIPLHSSLKTSDFLFCISDPYQCSNYFNDSICSSGHGSDTPSFLPAINDFAALWYRQESLTFKNLVNIWLEYDFEDIQRSDLRYSFFFAPAQGMHPLMIVSVTNEVINTLSKKHLSKATISHLLHCISNIPSPGWPSQIGRMFARNDDSLRLFIQQIPLQGIMDYLEKIGYPYSGDILLNDLLNDCYTLADHVDLDIDVRDSTGDGIGLECSFREMKSALLFLDHLFSKGLCTWEKHDALSAYLSNLTSNSKEGLCAFFSHFKIAWHPQHKIKTKAYLGYAAEDAATRIIRTKPLKH